MSRFRIFVLLAALAALATAFAACGGSSSDSGSSEDPQKTIENATLEGVKSGTLDLSLGIKAEGEEGGDLAVSLSGPFQSQGKENPPELDLTAKASGNIGGEAVNFDGGLTLLSDRAFVDYEGTEYEVDPTTFGFVKSAFEQAQQRGSQESGDVTACQKAAAGIKIGDFVDNLAGEGNADVDGTSTTKVSGDLNTEGAVDAIIKLTESPACSAQLEAAGPLPLGELEKAKGELTSAVKKAHVDVYVGDDHIIRRIAAELTIEPKGTSSEKVEVEFDLSLGSVNEEQDITAPSGAKPLEGLFRQLGVNPLELLEAGSGGGAGLGGLLEGVTGGKSSSSGGGSSAGGSSSGGASAAQQAYLECLQGAETPTDLQKCASLLK
ncbi:MAG TPA: hypothetical protein VGC49_05805 [Solirubrobacterales bacterium]